MLQWNSSSIIYSQLWYSNDKFCIGLKAIRHEYPAWLPLQPVINSRLLHFTCNSSLISSHKSLVVTTLNINYPPSPHFFRLSFTTQYPLSSWILSLLSQLPSSSFWTRPSTPRAEKPTSYDPWAWACRHRPPPPRLHSPLQLPSPLHLNPEPKVRRLARPRLSRLSWMGTSYLDFCYIQFLQTHSL